VLEPGVLQPEEAEAEGGVEHVRLDAIQLVVLETLRRDPAAGARVGVGGLGEELGQLFRTAGTAVNPRSARATRRIGGGG
jgi:hypothetical protein